jgi:hypothetical protein
VLGDNAFECVDPINVAGESVFREVGTGVRVRGPLETLIVPLLGNLDFEPNEGNTNE